MPAFTNHLANETSPYLKQHAHNPVDWYPWGPEALARARELNRPIFLSIGYSACHWCHVMERESFEDPEIGRLLNDHFVSIKVDREERPDVDQIYMDFVVRSTGHGGWPMSVFLTPDLKPFHGGTYYPPDDRYGGQMPSFRRLLGAIADAWRNRHGDVLQSADHVAQQLREGGRIEPAEGALDESLLRNAVHSLSRAFDRQYGGFGQAPKFPHPMGIRLLLRAWKRFGDEDALNLVKVTLDHMARGGIYDQLGGGFHRYSTDARWLVPHFEKMLYDNALLTSAYLEAFQATGESLYRTVAEETLNYVRREMTSPEGPFYSTQDADSEGVEGKFFVWSSAEVEGILGKDLTDTFSYVYDVTTEGNWEGHNILHRVKTYEQDSKMLRVPAEELKCKLADAKRKLFEARSRRVPPGRDEKVLAAWNGLMIAAFAQAAQVLDDPTYAATASRAADFVLKTMRVADGRLLRTWGAGGQAKLNAYLEDYAYFIDALVSLYEATFEPHWIESALDLTRVTIEQFWDDSDGGFYFTGRDHEALITRTKDLLDNATPSGNAVVATGLLRLAKLTGRHDLEDKAAATLRLCRGLMAERPVGCGQMLLALDFYLGPVQEFAVVGAPEAEETRRVLRAIRKPFRPNKVVALERPGAQVAERVIPLLAGKREGGGVTTYVCRNFTCESPLVGAEAVESKLGF
ncbi:MAG TPA: thioredoxin domain-containing protein [Gemmataceae bacterium]|nr:thioredoxin domain-containing protein [Gemmataceae bacterium]